MQKSPLDLPADDVPLSSLLAMHGAAWVIVHACEASGSGQMEPLRAAMRELSQARGRVLAELIRVAGEAKDHAEISP